MRILLLGKNGLLGSAFQGLLVARFDCDLRAIGRDELDVCDFSAVQSCVNDFSPDFVINCTGFTNVDLAETETGKAQAMKLNCEAVGKLAKLCEEVAATLIHFSSDYVFDGLDGLGYLETAIPHPINVYGESKFLGELEIAKNSSRYFIVRSSWLFGPDGRNFVDTMLALARGKNVLSVVNDQHGCPSYTLDLARAVIENFIDSERESGVYHLSNSGATNWADFAREIFRIAGVRVQVNGISSEEFVRPARRPKNSVLINSLLPLLRDWREALAEYLGAS